MKLCKILKADLFRSKDIKHVSMIFISGGCLFNEFVYVAKVFFVFLHFHSDLLSSDYFTTDRLSCVLLCFNIF